MEGNKERRKRLLYDENKKWRNGLLREEITEKEKFLKTSYYADLATKFPLCIEMICFKSYCAEYKFE